MRTVFICFISALLLSLFACGKAPKVASFHGMTMGTTYSIKIVDDGDVNVPELQQRVDDKLKEMNHIFSTYIPNSELMRLNATETGKEVAISKALYEVLKLNEFLSKESEGSFNMAIAPLINLWGFGEQDKAEMVDTTQVQKILLQIDTTNALTVSNSTLIKNKPLQLNMSATAKGYAVDQIAKMLSQEGYNNYLVEIGGELRGSGVKPNDEPWIIAIEKPVANERSFQQLLGVKNISIATSGDYRNFYEEEGKRLSHIIDPKTGYPINHHLASVTVLHEDCAMADGLATAMLVMGEERAKALAEKLGVAVYFIYKSTTSDGFITWHNAAMQAYFLN